MRLLCAKKPLPQIPLAVLCIGCHDDMLPAVADMLQLEKCVSNGLINVYLLRTVDINLLSVETVTIFMKFCL